MNAQQIFDLAREYGAEHPGITFDLAALLRYTRKVQEMEREACAAICDTTPPYPFRPSIEAAHAIRARSNP